MGLEPPAAELAAFLHGEVTAADFRHADHVRMAFEILRRHDFLGAAKIYSSTLKQMAARAGNPGAYHETITVAFLALVAERMAGQDYESFAAFSRAHAGLLDKAMLSRWYTPDRLRSALARATFVLPEPAR